MVPVVGFESHHPPSKFARVAELVDALVLGTSTFGVRVRVSPLVKLKCRTMAKIYHKEFKQKLDEKNKIDWTNEPRHENKYKTNLEAKRRYFKRYFINI